MAADWTVAEFGDLLQTKDGVDGTKNVLAGKTRIAIYFSAHWCPPCRGFTPVLAEFYEQLKEEDRNALEIVFVSSDSDDGSFEEYYGQMPWVAVPFQNRELAQGLGSKYGVRGIPTLVVLDANNGRVIDKDGRSTVAAARGDTSKPLAKWV